MFDEAEGALYSEEPSMENLNTESCKKVRP